MSNAGVWNVCGGILLYDCQFICRKRKCVCFAVMKDAKVYKRATEENAVIDALRVMRHNGLIATVINKIVIKLPVPCVTVRFHLTFLKFSCVFQDFLNVSNVCIKRRLWMQSCRSHATTFQGLLIAVLLYCFKGLKVFSQSAVRCLPPWGCNRNSTVSLRLANSQHFIAITRLSVRYQQ